MRIEKYLNTDANEVVNKNFNIWVGISLGNKYFTKKHIKAYMEWALQYTKERMLVVIGDALHAPNLEVLDNKTPGAALRKALKVGDQKFAEVNEVLSELPENQKSKVHVVRWKDILDTNNYQQNYSIIKSEYQKNEDFREHVREIVKNGRQDRADRLSRLSGQELDRLCEYVLSEIPHFVNGVQGYGDDTVYTLIPYPGLTKLDELFVGLQNKTHFPEVAEKLNITNKIAILEAYVE